MEKMMMPAYYNVLSTEEMTYTEGGATAVSYTHLTLPTT